MGRIMTSTKKVVREAVEDFIVCWFGCFVVNVWKNKIHTKREIGLPKLSVVLGMPPFSGLNFSHAEIGQKIMGYII